MELLDKKGLTTVWAAIKNTFTSKSDADGKYAKKSQAIGDIDLDYTGESVIIHAYVVEGPNAAGDTTIDQATSEFAGVMTAIDKVKLDGIDSGANNYKLPVASTNSKGGIKTGYNNNDSSSWAVKVDNNSNAYVKISGLHHYISSDDISSLQVISPNASTNYNAADILFLHDVFYHPAAHAAHIHFGQLKASRSARHHAGKHL